MKLLTWAGVRAHVLLPHELVTALQDDRPVDHSLTADRGTIFHVDKPVLAIHKHGDMPHTRVDITALTDVWLQEVGLTIKVQTEPLSTWRGFGLHNRWTSEPISLILRDPHRSTVHFSRVRWLDKKKLKPNPDYTVGVEYRSPTGIWRFYSEEGFAELLNERAGVVPWERCQVGSRNWQLAGVVLKDNDSPVRTWELAGHPEGPWPGDPLTPHPASDWHHFHGWGSGAGAVVQAHPPHFADQIPRLSDAKTGRDPSQPIDRLWDPPTWRFLKRGRTISQVISMSTRRLK